MIFLDSNFGIPQDKFIDDSEKKIKLVIDPRQSYFNILNLISDKKTFDKIVLIHGCEPEIINNITEQIITYHNYFDRIYSYDDRVILNCKNSEKFEFGSCWINTDKNLNLCYHKKNYYNTYNTKKKFKLSFIKTDKNELPGHKFRNNIIDILNKPRNFELYYPNFLENKIPLFYDSSFHISIENSQYKNYFTEKIIDCFMSYTIPIYWGCPNIGDFFNMDGILFFNNELELIKILDNLNEFDYTKRIKAIEENYKIAYEKYGFFFDRVIDLVSK